MKRLRGLLQHINLGVPQRSVLGPIRFNIVIDHISYSLQKDLHNFEDDNTVSAMVDSLPTLLELLTEKTNTVIDCIQVI